MGRAVAKEGERQGDFLCGKYLLEDCLGIGGMGEVYRATNVSLGRKVAIKVLNKEHTGNEDDVMRFLREARAAAAVRHPNVVDVLDVARDDDGTPFIVQELLSGQDLEQHLGASGGQLQADEALEILIPVAAAVAAAHAGNVVHRDLKPANIFLAREGDKIVPKVLDFGACLYQTVGALSAKEQRMLIGTPHYMAPEQISTAMDVDARADIWAMGVILYELIVGETPFEAEDANAVMKLVRTRNVPLLRKVEPSAPAVLEELVARCLERDRKMRFADAAVMRAELENVRSAIIAASRGERRRAPDAELDPSSLRVRDDKRDDKPASKRGDDRREADEPRSQRVPSLVLKGAKMPTKRRGAALLTLSSPDEPVAWDTDPPKSASRPIEAAKAAETADAAPASSRSGSSAAKPARSARTAADVIREAEEASGATSPSRPPPASTRAVPPPPPPPEHKDEGALRGLDFEEDLDAARLDLELELPSSQHPPPVGHSSMPPVLDPRVASGAIITHRKSDRPPASVPPPSSDKGPRSTRGDAPLALTPALTPPLTPALTQSQQRRSPFAEAEAEAEAEAPKPWPTNAKLTFGAAIVLPALAAFIVLRFAPVVMAPIGHAMRGDSPLASGVLAVLALVGAAALAARSLGSSRSRGMLIAAIGAVLLGIIMIIVTFSASETAELGVPPAVGGIVAFIAPIVPLGLGLAAFTRARSAWLSPYERSDAIKFVVIASLMLFAVLELGPLGAVHAAASTAAKTAPTHP